MLDTISIVAITVGSTLSLLLAGVCVKYHVKTMRLEDETERLHRLNIKYNKIFKNKIMSINSDEELKEESVKTDYIMKAESV
jgi:hypothetical protein